MASNESQIVPRYVSDESYNLSSATENPTPAKRPRQNIVYHTVETFNSLEEVKVHITKQNLWKFKSKSSSFDCTKLLYLCKYDNQCSARLCILLPNDSNDVHLQTTDGEHDHQPVKLNGISTECKEAIMQLWNNGIRKPKFILDALRKQQVACPTTTQLNNYLARVRRGEGPAILSLGQLEAHICSSNFNVDCIDSPFIVNYFVDHHSKKFGIFWSSKRLLSLMDESQSINIDATYKLTYLGFPVFITGTTDQMKRFHPFGIALLTNEDTESFAFVFQSLLKANVNYKPTILIADCAAAITRAFQLTFPHEFVRLHCWYHVKRNLDSKLKSLSKDKYNKVQTDLYQLQVATSTAQFNVAVKCFITKWSQDDDVKEFIQFFQEEYVDQRANWYEGAALGYPSTNNALEATNSTIKKEFTFRERLPLKQFIETAEEIVRRWSVERNPDDESAKVTMHYK